MSSPPQASSAPDARPARRPGWFRRHKFATFVVALLAAMLALRLAWGWYCAKELAAAWDEVRRRGEPTTPEDLAVEPLPDRENAWLVYAQAAAAIKPGIDSPRNSALEYSTYPPFGPKWHALAAASEQGNAAAFPIARRARGLPRSWFPGGLPHADAQIPQLNDARRLAGTLSDGALYIAAKPSRVARRLGLR